jgi:hypothetical protein
VPPLAARLWEYSVPTVPDGSVVVDMAKDPATTVILIDCESVRSLLSVTNTMKFVVPDVVGVPLIVPVGESARSAGREPEVIDHK